MIIDVDGTAVHLIDTDDRNVIHEQAGGYERESLIAWARMVKPGRVAIDVGAYTGLFSIIAALRGAYAVALEPMPANRWRLSANAALNKANIKIIGCAASDFSGMAKLNYNPRVPLTTGASLEVGVKAHAESLLVPCLTIDSLAYTEVAAIKIDVERHELSVLRGAMQIIKRDRPAMLIETLDDDMRMQVMSLLPRYAIAAVLDVRNTLFRPK